MKPFKNKSILAKMDKITSEIELTKPEVRQERVQYMKEMLSDYRNSEERFPKIERQLENAILEMGKTSKVNVKVLKEEKKRLESKL